MVKAKIFEKFYPATILLLGDYMLDRYTVGKVKRISPEAPVPVLHAEKEEMLPGGAGNVILNLLSLGTKVSAMGRVGDDFTGRYLFENLKKEGASVDALLYQEGYQTPLKNRMMADNQQLLRVDFEKVEDIPLHMEEQIMHLLPQMIRDVDAVALSDYGKGFLTDAIIQKTIQLAMLEKLPVIVDPKGVQFAKYKGATLIKPNLAEAYAASKLSTREPLENVAEVLLEITQAKMLLITRSEAGMTLFHSDGKRQDFPVRSKEVKDVTGAGDTVLSVITTSLACGLDISHAVQLANIAAGIAIERVGCSRVTLSEIARRFLELDMKTKIFDENHFYALQKALEGKSFTLLCLEEAFLTPHVLRQIKHLSSLAQQLILSIHGSVDEEFVQFLASLEEVDFIVGADSLKHFCETMRPTHMFSMDGDTVVPVDSLQKV